MLSTSFGQLRRKTVHNQVPAYVQSLQSYNLKSMKNREDEQLIQLKKNQVKKSTILVQPQNQSAKLTQEQLNKSIALRRKQNRDLNYKKNSNLNLGDYLRLYSMSKRSKRSSPSKKGQQQQSNVIFTNRTGQKIRSTHAIDTAQSIRVVREHTKKQLQAASKGLSLFLKELNNSQYLKSDQQSLVLMCNVLHVFQDKIMQGIKYAQQLVDDRNRDKQTKDFKNFSKNGMSTTKKTGASESRPKINKHHSFISFSKTVIHH